MSHEADLSFLDRPEILEVIFPVVYSSFPFFKPPSDMPGYPIKVEEGVDIDCGFWPTGRESPTILYFHGNGETVADYDWIASVYNQKGMNLFVADYRGYGSSTGKPTISNMLRDAHVVFKGFKEIMGKEGFGGEMFLMGRSLGSMPAIELAFHYQEQIRGLIIESGAANNLRRVWDSLPPPQLEKLLSQESQFLNKVKIRQVHQPTLVIHGEYDEILPVSEGIELYENSGAEDKRIVVVPRAGHNDILMLEPDLYFDTLAEFIKSNS